MPRKLLAVALAATFSLPAFAVQRTFISTSGSDANPCSTTQPCRSIAVALAATDPGGEIIVLGSGGYGSATINKSVTIQSPSGTYAGISVFPGSDGITVNGANIAVVLRGLSINGQGGGKGVSFVQGDALFIEDCMIANMNSAGIAVTAAADVLIRDVTVRGNGSDGVQIASAASATISRLRAERNALAGVSLSNGPQGVGARQHAGRERPARGVRLRRDRDLDKITLENSTLTGNAVPGWYSKPFRRAPRSKASRRARRWRATSTSAATSRRAAVAQRRWPRRTTWSRRTASESAPTARCRR